MYFYFTYLHKNNPCECCITEHHKNIKTNSYCSLMFNFKKKMKGSTQRYVELVVHDSFV